MRYFFHIAYNGGNFHGWQRQTNSLSVQQWIEDNLSKIFNQKIVCIGCGRTDAGVHASQYFFHVDIEQNWDFDLKFKLNKMLGKDVFIIELIKMEEAFHAQFDAKERSYSYFIHRKKDPFLHDVSAEYELKDALIPKMEEALQLLLKYQDYKYLCKQPELYDNTLCNISSVSFKTSADLSKIRIDISSNRFLRRMVRLIVGNLVEIGKGKLSIETFESYLKLESSPAFFLAAYPQGLYLSKVKYDFLEREENQNLYPFTF